ncbi:MAG TPA: hypothetical protein VHC21_01115 [Candidatus Saccharimonadales bacterium]|nr:hypothetical protein [Candidatus Saccharimonadales bacterium]
MADAIVPAGAPTPVMDVVAPPAEKEEKSETRPAEAAVDPVDALAAADQKSQQAAASHKPAAKNSKLARAAERAPAKPPESAGGNGVGLAITATVIIVFGLAILAVYAYLQTNK